MTDKTKPDPEDVKAVVNEHGRLPGNASDTEHAARYRLAQVRMLIRLNGLHRAD
jgi:hypothetical protein